MPTAHTPMPARQKNDLTLTKYPAALRVSLVPRALSVPLAPSVPCSLSARYLQYCPVSLCPGPSVDLTALSRPLLPAAQTLAGPLLSLQLPAAQTSTQQLLQPVTLLQSAEATGGAQLLVLAVAALPVSRPPPRLVPRLALAPVRSSASVRALAPAPLPALAPAPAPARAPVTVLDPLRGLSETSASGRGFAFTESGRVVTSGADGPAAYGSPRQQQFLLGNTTDKSRCFCGELVTRKAGRPFKVSLRQCPDSGV